MQKFAVQVHDGHAHGGVREDGPESLFASPDGFLGVLALDELPDLAADRRQDVQERLIRLSYRRAEELNDPENLAAEPNRESECSVQSLLRRQRSPWKIRILNDIGDPERLTAD